MSNKKRILGLLVIVSYIVLVYIGFRVYQHVTRETYVPFQELQYYFAALLVLAVSLSALYTALFVRKKAS
ncbi:MAG: hypothetical protein DRJ52_07275 [Thermoprotei archaeon]|nr:MAG: hypothetical protein DRJ52_07275 [Thermoprotei archaeon]RLF00593.1 MAG: hypothetical protein DRJ63_02105 [Thermoprotei archaeon]HDI74346.1 hypothetical protein [Thermoprotei archaeon]